MKPSYAIVTDWAVMRVGFHRPLGVLDEPTGEMPLNPLLPGVTPATASIWE
jgi:hypothetical protein